MTAHDSRISREPKASPSSPSTDGAKTAYVVPIVVALAAARCLALALGWLADILGPVAPVPQSWFVLSQQTLLDGWLRWDTGWVLMVARTGYQSALAIAPPGHLPLPLVPMAGRLLAVSGLPVEIGLLGLSNAASVVGILLIAVAGRGADRVTGALLLALGPWALMGVAPFPEAVLLLLAGGCLVALDRKQSTAALVLGSLSWLTAASGVALWLGTVVQTSRERVWSVPRVVAALAGPALAAIFLLGLSYQSGRPLAGLVEAIWGVRVNAPLLSRWPSDLAGQSAGEIGRAHV
jgi:hypothetical protein